MTTTAISPVRTTAPTGPGADPPSQEGESVETPLLPVPAGGGLGDGSLSTLAALLTRADQVDRAASRRIETAADEAAMRDAQAHAQALINKADADRDEGLASGIGDGISGVCSIATAFVGESTTSNKAGASGGGFGWTAALRGAGSGAEAGGKVASGLFHANADLDDADATTDDARAQGDVRRYNQAHDDTLAANASIQRVEQFLDQVQQAENATRLAAASYRA
jgi:hypothetical protein